MCFRRLSADTQESLVDTAEENGCVLSHVNHEQPCNSSDLLDIDFHSISSNSGGEIRAPCNTPFEGDMTGERRLSSASNPRLSPTFISLENAEHEINVNDLLADMRFLVSSKLVSIFLYHNLVG